MKTYLIEKIGVFSRLRELAHLYEYQKRGQNAQISGVLENMDAMEKNLEKKLGVQIKDKKILEIGPGQKLTHLYYFARFNDYLGVDLDLPVTSITPKAAVKMLRTNGVMRTIKTLGRRTLGIDKAHKKEVCRQLGISQQPDAKLQHMDATNLDLYSSSFDIVFSISVFEHLPKPELVMKEIARVLKPHGVAYIVTHLYTSDSGIHDPRVFGEHDNIPYWSHLREKHSHLVKRNCFLNELRLENYERQFKKNWPDCEFEYVSNGERALHELQSIRELGELKEYSDKELMTDALIAVWKKA